MREQLLRGLAGVTVMLAAALAGPGPATASRVVTFTEPTRFVDPAQEPASTFTVPRDPKVNVLLPDDYDRNPRRRYPVLYLLHGASSEYGYWLDASKGAAAEIAKGFPGVIVMPDGGRFSMYVDWWNGGERGNPRWREFHLRQLRRTIERRFRIRRARRWHAIAGVSMGGQGAMRYAAQLPGYFGSVAAFSPAMLDMQSPLLFAEYHVIVTPLTGHGYEKWFGPVNGFYATANNPVRLLENLRHTRMFVTSGDGVPCPGDPVLYPTAAADLLTEVEVRRQTSDFATAARRAGFEIAERKTCGIHSWPLNRRALADAIDWGLFRPVAERPRRWEFSTASPSGPMWNLRYRMHEPVTALNTFRREGGVLSGSGAGGVTIRGRHGCRFRATLPFRRRLPAACRATRP
ncbi:MAG TPA: alpha/beta hydrolase-fold protein [Vicinamibacterales bacterium]|nr:alpha/beta hydrolase-fold protein [Vicinamibacterales bacterium]